MKLVTCTFLVGLLASAGLAQFTEVYQTGLTQQRAGRYAEARKDFEEALKLATTNEEKADCATGHRDGPYDGQKNYTAARAEFAKVLAIEGATPDQKRSAVFHRLGLLLRAEICLGAGRTGDGAREEGRDGQVDRPGPNVHGT